MRAFRLLCTALALVMLVLSAVVSSSLPLSQSASAAAPSVSCAWLGETDQRDVNIGAPDLDAHYWLTPLSVNHSESVTISGTYPKARYFSLTAYNMATFPIGSLYDQQIRPDKGSVNPYLHKTKPGATDRYTVHVLFQNKPKHPAANTLYVNPASNGHSEPLALMEYRVYVPTDPASPQGGDFPSVTTEAGTTPIATLGGCSTTPPSFGAPAWETLARLSYPADAPTPAVSGAKKTPSWTRQFGNSFGNPQNAYLATTIAHHFGDLVVIHSRVPTFPNNRKGVPAYAKAQVRYWSICTYDSGGNAVYGCAADYHAAIRHHTITYVISDPNARPANATEKHGVTWLPWGFQNGAQIVYRNMLPAKSFKHAAQAVRKPAQNKRAHKLMGSYYPTAVYCTTKRFEAGGWHACFKAGGIR